MVKKIKRKKHKPRLHGHKMHQGLQVQERKTAQRNLQEQAHRRRLTKKDLETGEEYILARLSIKDKDRVAEYQEGISKAIDESGDEADQQADSVRRYLQDCVDSKLLRPFPCSPGEKPTCRIYGGENRRVVVLGARDPEAGYVFKKPAEPE